MIWLPPTRRTSFLVTGRTSCLFPSSNAGRVPLPGSYRPTASAVTATTSCGVDRVNSPRPHPDHCPRRASSALSTPLPCMLRAGACTPVYRARRGLRRANDEQTGRPLKDSCQVASRSADVDRSLADVGLKTVRRLTAFSRGEPKLGTNRTVL